MKKLFSSRFFLLCLCIVLFAFGLRVFRIHKPSDFYFDEVYHGFTATTFLHNDPKGYEYWQTPPKGVAYEWTHPPLAKLLMAGGMVLFGENSFGWRISSVLMGTGVVAMIGFLSYELFGSKRLTLFALLLASVDGLLVSMSRIAMNDMHFLVFSLLAVYFFIRFRKKVFVEHSTHTLREASLSALFLGLALASKWTALYLGGALALDIIGAVFIYGKLPFRRLFLALILAALIIPTAYMTSYGQFFLQGHTLIQWKETTQQMWWYHTGLKATHGYQSRPYQWILDLRPVWMHVDYSQNDRGVIGNIYNVGNPLLFWSGFLVVLSVTLRGMFVGLTHLKVFLFEEKKRKLPFFPWSLWFPLFLYGALWIPWQFSPRIMFFYHYAPSIPFLCILLAYALEKLVKKGGTVRLLGYGILLCIIVASIALYPLNTGLPMEKSYFDTVFFLFPSWR